VWMRTMEREGARYTVLPAPDAEGRLSVSVFALPGCVAVGRARRDALSHAREAITGWLETEAEAGRGPLRETAELIAGRGSKALHIIQENREAGEVPADRGYELEPVTIEVPFSVPV